MCVDPETKAKPQFYQDYVKDVQKIIVGNADSEFEALWKLKAETGTPFTILSDKLSVAINKLGDELANSRNYGTMILNLEMLYCWIHCHLCC